eukprot:4580413-Ditylum_brightwellii.AAC.1
MGFSLPLLSKVENLIVKGEIYPMGIHHQTLAIERGKLVRKDRAVHNLSYPKKSGKAINQQVRMEELAPCIYEFTFLLVIHYIHYLRIIHHDSVILQLKGDLTKGYKRATV